MPGSSALAVILYGTVPWAGISKIFPGGSLEMNSHLLPALVDSENRDSHALSGLFTRLWSVPDTVNESPVFSVCASNVSSWILTNLLWSCAWTPWPSTWGAMVAIAESPITAPISTIITVLVPFVILHLGLPEKTKIYALLSPRHYLNPIYMCSLGPKYNWLLKNMLAWLNRHFKTLF